MEIKYKQIRFDLLFLLKIKLLKALRLVKPYAGMHKTKTKLNNKIDYFYHNFPKNEQYSRTEYFPDDLVKHRSLIIYNDNKPSYYKESEWFRDNYLSKSQLEEIWNKSRKS